MVETLSSEFTLFWFLLLHAFFPTFNPHPQPSFTFFQLHEYGMNSSVAYEPVLSTEQYIINLKRQLLQAECVELSSIM